MRITHHGHSCVEFESKGTRVLFDPGTFSDFDDVSGLDAVVVTHQHPDHLDPDRLDGVVAANPGAAWFADPQSAAVLDEHGVAVNVTRAGETYEVGAFRLEGVGSTHAEIHPYIDGIANVGIVVSGDGEPRVFHPGDSLEGRPGRIDYLCVPVTAPWQAVKETIEFVRAVRPRALVPIHDRTASPQGREIYMTHIGGYGLDGGVPVLDMASGETRELT